MGTKTGTFRFRKSNHNEIIINDDHNPIAGYPKVRGVHYSMDNKSWISGICINGTRKRFTCGDGYEGYQKAVQIRKKLESIKFEHEIKILKREINV